MLKTGNFHTKEWIYSFKENKEKKEAQDLARIEVEKAACLVQEQERKLLETEKAKKTSKIY